MSTGKKDRIPELHLYEWSITRWATSPTRTMLDATGRGVYRELLDLCYAQGSFPDSQEFMARHGGCSVEELTRIWPLIEKHFPLDRKDKTQRRNKYADVYRASYFRYIADQRKRGKSSAKTRVERSKNAVTKPSYVKSDSGGDSTKQNGVHANHQDINDMRNAGSMLVQPLREQPLNLHDTTLHDTTRHERKGTVVGASGEADWGPALINGKTIEEWAELWYERHPKKGEEGLVLRAVADLAQKHPEWFPLIEQAQIRACKSTGWRKENGQYAPKLASWLLDGGWKQFTLNAEANAALWSSLPK